MKKEFKIPYALRENLRLIGLRPFVKWGIILSLAAWFFWPEPEAPEPPVTPQQQALPHEPVPPAATETKEDLRDIMTAGQTSFYWDSFQWMMSQGPELKPASLDGNVVFVSYLKDAAFKTENGLTCRPFSEKLIVAGKFNLRRGIGCQSGADGWCRQMVGEKAQCRSTGPNGFALDMQTTLTTLRIDWDRNLNRFRF